MVVPSLLGCVMLDLQGLSLTGDEERRLQHPATGGVILFSRNYEHPKQLQHLITAIRRLRPQILIAVDHEGGRVQRFRRGFTRIAPAGRYRELAGAAAAEATSIAAAAGWLMAAELRASDIDFSFAPVLDVDSGVSQIIGDRAFSQGGEEVSSLAGAFFRGMQRAGMAGVGKHFPGHGSVAEDSHLALPVDRRTWEEIECRDLIPFRALIDAGLEGIMPAHVLYPLCDDRPAGFSPFWIREVLRQRLGFAGAIFSDDLSMAGAEAGGDYIARAQCALAAGCDMVLVCNAPEQADAVLDALPKESKEPDPNLQIRLTAMRGRFPIDPQKLLASSEWREAVARLETLSEDAR